MIGCKQTWLPGRLSGQTRLAWPKMTDKIVKLKLLANEFDITAENVAYSEKQTHFNPYRKIPETISKERAVTQGISRKLFPAFFQTFFIFCNFGACLRRFSGNYFQVNFMSTYRWKNIFSQKRVMTQRLFRKLFPISGNSFRKFFWVITRIYEISNFI